MLSYFKFVSPAAAIAFGLSTLAAPAFAGEIQSVDVQKVEKAEVHKAEVQKAEFQRPERNHVEIQKPEKPERPHR